MRFEARGRAMMATSALTIALVLLLAAVNAAPAGADAVLGAVTPAPGATPAKAPAGAVAVRKRPVRSSIGLLSRRTHVRAGRIARVSGRVRPGTAGRLVVLQRRSGHGWRTIARTRTLPGGRFTLRHRTRSSVSATVRVRVAGGRGVTRRTRRAGRLEVFRSALASWYGSGTFLACGGRLTPGMMGVAHKTLPCGTQVTIRYRGRQVRVPVVDRGPFSGAREFDLGPGVRRALGFEGVGVVHVAH